MIAEYARIDVLYNEPERFGVRMSRVPRALFDLIPCEELGHETRMGMFWTKTMTLACEPGKHVELVMFCEEPPPLPSPVPRKDAEQGRE